MPSTYLKLWYSFNVGPIHNLVFSTELDYSRGSEQFNFIFSVSCLLTVLLAVLSLVFTVLVWHYTVGNIKLQWEQCSWKLCCCCCSPRPYVRAATYSQSGLYETRVLV